MPPPEVAGRRLSRLLTAFLFLAALGLAMMLSGLAWDARMHAGDPGLAEREGVFTLGNLSHLLSAVGLGLAAAGIVGAGATAVADASVRAPRAALAAAAGLLAAGFVAAGASALSVGGDHHHHDMSQFVDPADATAAERSEAERLLDRSRAVASEPRFRTVAAARAAGYGWGLEDVDRPIDKEPALLHGRSSRHYFDDRTLDPERPESVVYWRTPDGELKLVAFMYRLPPGQSPPDFGGPLVRWHGHDKCKDPKTRETLGDPVDGNCPEGQVLKDNPEMTHVWLTDDIRTAYAVEAPADALEEALERKG